VVVVPVHFAIEGNRRDAINIDADRTSHPNSQGPPEPSHPASQRTRPAESDVNGEP
jgi:hypothetical protein